MSWTTPPEGSLKEAFTLPEAPEFSEVEAWCQQQVTANADPRAVTYQLCDAFTTFLAAYMHTTVVYNPRLVASVGNLADRMLLEKLIMLEKFDADNWDEAGQAEYDAGTDAMLDEREEEPLSFDDLSEEIARMENEGNPRG